MIRSIYIQLFQSHQKTHIDFSKGVNFIQGQSHSGKSSIIKAFDWIFNNEPKGDVFRSSFADTKKPTRVYVELNNGVIIERIRDGKNSYIIDDGKKETRFDALSSNIPNEVQFILNISSVNIQSQNDGFFLLDETPGKVAEYLSKAVGLDVIGSSIKIINSIYRKAKEAFETASIELQDATQAIKKYNWLDSAETEILLLLEQNKQLAELEKKREKLFQYEHDLEWEQEKVCELSILLPYEDTIKQLLKLGEEEKEINIQIDKLDSFYKDLTYQKNQIKKIDLEITKLEKEYDKTLKETGICPLCHQKIKS